MAKGPLVQEFFDSLTDEEKIEVERRTAELRAEYLTLQQLRRETGLTQEALSERLEMARPNVSRLERNSDMLLSTLRSYVEALGGTLNLTVQLPDKPPVNLAGLSDLIEPSEGEAHLAQ